MFEYFCPKAHLRETDFCWFCHDASLPKQSVSPRDILSLSSVFDSCHSWFPEEGTTAQVHVLKKCVLFALLLMADMPTMKNFFKSHAVLMNTVTLMINAIPHGCSSLPGSAVEFMAVSEDTDVHFLKASSPDKGFILF